MPNFALPLVAWVLLAAAALGRPTPAQSATEGVLHGAVQDVLGEPIPGATVQVFMDREFQRRAGSTKASVRGTFLMNVPGKRPFVKVSAPGKAAYQVRVGTFVGPLIVTLHDAVNPSFEVVDPAGRPLAGAHVAIIHRGLGPPARNQMREAITDDDGIVSFDGLPVGETRVSTFVPGHGFRLHSVWLRETQRYSLTVAKSELADLNIRLLGCQPDDCLAATARLCWDDPRSRYLSILMPSVLTEHRFNKDGMLRLRSIPRTQVQVIGFVPGCQGTSRTVAPAEFAAEVTIEPHRLEYRSVLGKVISDAPLAGERLEGKTYLLGVRETAPLATDGSFRMSLAPGKRETFFFRLVGSRLVLAGSDHRGRRTVDATSPVALRAVVGARLRCRVLDHTGRPAAFASFQMRRARPKGKGLDPSIGLAVADHAGIVMANGLAAFGESIYLDSNLELGRTESIELAPGAEAVFRDLRLQAPAVVTGRVLDANKAPVGGMMLLVNYENRSESVYTDASGHFCYRSGREGTIELGLPSSWQQPANAHLTLKTGKLINVELIGTEAWSRRVR